MDGVRSDKQVDGKQCPEWCSELACHVISVTDMYLCIKEKREGAEDIHLFYGESEQDAARKDCGTEGCVA